MIKSIAWRALGALEFFVLLGLGWMLLEWVIYHIPSPAAVIPAVFLTLILWGMAWLCLSAAIWGEESTHD